MVYTVRYRCGQQLAIEAPVEADLVSTVPESATPAALGYATKVFTFFFFFFETRFLCIALAILELTL
jgi:glutamine phosphoribosylpyrophosphate amidotransferase